MQGTLFPGRRTTPLAIAVWSLLEVLLAGGARADDLTTLSGQTFHDVRPVRVEPDGVTWKHAGGVVKVDFSDSPRAVCEAYRYDNTRANLYRETRAQERRQADERAQALLQTDAERQRARAQAQLQQGQPPDAAPAGPGPSPAASNGPTLVYRHGLSDAVLAAGRALDEQAAARSAQEAATARAAGGLGNPAFWKYVPGVGSAPVPLRTDLPTSAEYRSTLKRAPGGFLLDSTQDTFFQPNYMTRSYDDDVERAAAFARGAPSK